MKTTLHARRLASLLAFTALSTLTPQLSTCFAQGNLTPPGAPAPTMKSLDQIEPRTDVTTLAGDAGHHHLITVPGSYYLTGNLDVSLAHGIGIRTNGVTLNLGGFVIRRAGGSGGNGVEVSAGLRSVSVRNGAIEGFANGVLLQSAELCRLRQLNIRGGTNGIHVSGNSRLNLILDCMVTGTSGDGILLRSEQGNTSHNLIQRCTVSEAGASGISLDGSGTGSLVGNGILDCAISGTGSDGILLDGGNAIVAGNLITHSSVANSGGSGVNLSALFAVLDGNLLSDLTIARPAEHGINLTSLSGGELRGNLVQRVTVSDPGPTYVNLEVVQGGNVSGNVVRDVVGRDGTTGISIDAGNTLAGYAADCNRIEANHLTRVPPFLIAPAHAVQTTDSSGNLIIKNTASGYRSGYTIDPDDTTGPAVSTAGALPNTHPDNHPWANFLY